MLGHQICYTLFEEIEEMANIDVDDARLGLGGGGQTQTASSRTHTQLLTMGHHPTQQARFLRY